MDYSKEMYYILFNKISDIINELQTLQSETEELFILQQENEVLQLVAADTSARANKKTNKELFYLKITQI